MGRRTMAEAAMAKMKAARTLARPRTFTCARPPTVFVQPKPSSTRLRSRWALDESRRRLAFGRSGRQRRLGRRHEPVAVLHQDVLHQDVAKRGETALLSGAFAEKARILVRRRGVGRVRPLGLAKVDFAVAPRSPDFRPMSPWDGSSSSTPRLSTSFHRPKNARRSKAPSPPAGREARTETLARSRA